MFSLQFQIETFPSCGIYVATLPLLFVLHLKWNDTQWLTLKILRILLVENITKGGGKRLPFWDPHLTLQSLRYQTSVLSDHPSDIIPTINDDWGLEMIGYFRNSERLRLRLSTVVFSSPCCLWCSARLFIISFSLLSPRLTPVLSITVRMWPMLMSPLAGFLYISNTLSSKLWPLIRDTKTPQSLNFFFQLTS